MSIFDFEPLSQDLTKDYLQHLQLDKEATSLEFLNRLIVQHQERVPFENYTRIIDFHDMPGHLPSIETFVERLSLGAGGVCWTMARSFGWLLKNLGFQVEYLAMAPGHLCLKVTLDQEYYVEVGYGAPIFEARPLKQSFQIETSWEKFVYQVEDDKVQVMRTPGPQKVLSFKTITAEEVEKRFQAGNVWGQNRFLTMLLIGKFQNGKVVRLANQKLQDYRSGTYQELMLKGSEIHECLKSVFWMDNSFYQRASELLQTRS